MESLSSTFRIHKHYHFLNIFLNTLQTSKNVIQLLESGFVGFVGGLFCFGFFKILSSIFTDKQRWGEGTNALTMHIRISWQVKLTRGKLHPLTGS